jgi:hypothetical protein
VFSFAVALKPNSTGRTRDDKSLSSKFEGAWELLSKSLKRLDHLIVEQSATQASAIDEWNFLTEWFCNQAEMM